MKVWRICRAPFADNALAGRGGLYASARWHTAPRPVVYTAESIALATLEILVHTDSDLVPEDLVTIEIDLPDSLDVSRVHEKDLPANWRESPGPPDLQRLGDEWLEGGSSVALRVPSAVIPTEFNYLLNPLHPNIHKIVARAPRKHLFDARLSRHGRGK